MSDSAVAEARSSLSRGRADYARAERAALQLLDESGVVKPPVDPIRLADQLGVRVVFAEFTPEMSSVSGFYDAEEATIYVNRRDYPPRQTFTVAHELGHHILHREWANSTDYRVLLREQEGSSDPYEQEANAFAANLLVPASMLDAYKNVASIPELADLFLVSVPVIKNRLNFEARRG